MWMDILKIGSGCMRAGAGAGGAVSPAAGRANAAAQPLPAETADQGQARAATKPGGCRRVPPRMLLARSLVLTEVSVERNLHADAA